jgi:hypothetical protein
VPNGANDFTIMLTQLKTLSLDDKATNGDLNLAKFSVNHS